MNGSSIQSSGATSTQAGDGRDDILWQHDNGLVYVFAYPAAGALDLADNRR